MKICVISTGIFQLNSSGGLSGYGGLEQIAWECARGLAARGHEVALVAPEGSTCPDVVIIPNGPVGNGDEFRSYNTYWSALPQFDVIIDHSWQKCSYMLKGEGVLRAPVLGVLHAPVRTMYQSLPPNVEKPSFVCISQDQANQFEAFHEVPARVCHNGIDLDFYKPMKIPRSNRFLFLARFSSIKGPHIAIKACKEAGKELDLIGDTSITNEPQYLEMCKAECDGKQLRLVGPATRGECVFWFSQAHALLHPTFSFREPYGLAPVEAMACGCPVLAPDYGALRETIIHGETGWLVNKSSVSDYNKLVRDLPEITPQMRERCRDNVQRFSISNMIRRYEELCVEAVDTGGW